SPAKYRCSNLIVQTRHCKSDALVYCGESRNAHMWLRCIPPIGPALVIRLSFLSDRDDLIKPGWAYAGAFKGRLDGEPSAPERADGFSALQSECVLELGVGV